MRRHCPEPSAAPSAYYFNCPVNYNRVCADGTGMIPECLPGGYIAILKEGHTQADVDEIALTIARGRALNKTLFCNTITSGDLDGCGLLEQRQVATFACSETYCNESGIPYCNEDSINYVVTE